MEYSGIRYMPFNESDFNKACKNGSVKTVRHILKKEPLNIFRRLFKKPEKIDKYDLIAGFFSACFKGHYEIVSLILEYEDDLPLLDGLHNACSMNELNALFMINHKKYGYHVNKKRIREYHNFNKIISLLIDKGVPVVDFKYADWFRLKQLFLKREYEVVLRRYYHRVFEETLAQIDCHPLDGNWNSIHKVNKWMRDLVGKKFLIEMEDL